MKIKRQTPQRLRQKCLRGNPDGDITAIVEGRPNYITTPQISEGTHPSLALLIRDIAKQLHALPSACDDTTRLTNVFTGRRLSVGAAVDSQVRAGDIRRLRTSHKRDQCGDFVNRSVA